MTDLVMGIATGYTWFDLEPFVVSLRRSGYVGRCVLITGDGPYDRPEGHEGLAPPGYLQKKLGQYTIETYDIGRFDEHPILKRFSVMPKIIDASEPLRYVLSVDTKDVVFQSDPVVWLGRYLVPRSLAVVSEGTTYTTCLGSQKNLREAFGNGAYEQMASQEVLNAGVIAGRAGTVRNLLCGIYELSATDLRRRTFTPTYADVLPDQTAMNILLRENTFADKTFIVHAVDGFVYELNHCEQGSFRDGMMYPVGLTVPFSILHQYTQEPSWRRIVRERYRDD